MEGSVAIGTRRRQLPWWVYGSLVANGLVLSALAWLGWRGDWFRPEVTSAVEVSSVQGQGELGRAGLATERPASYEERVERRRTELQVFSQQGQGDAAPLGILLGDSLSSAFPEDRLPPGWTWLNQAISGETTAGVRRRVADLKGLQPRALFVAIGINDLLRGIEDQRILENYRGIVRQIRRQHPDALLVVQSLLPHRGELSTWEGRDRLKRAPADRLRTINGRLRTLAEVEGAKYLDLYELFGDRDGKLDPRMTTDGLHLSPAGYDIWRGAIDAYVQGATWDVPRRDRN